MDLYNLVQLHDLVGAECVCVAILEYVYMLKCHIVQDINKCKYLSVSCENDILDVSCINDILVINKDNVFD